LGDHLSLPANGLGGSRATTKIMAALFAKQKTKFGGGKIGIGKRGRAKIPFPRPFPFLPARAEN